jgi:hypothetical protein
MTLSRTDTATELGERFLRALRTRDFDRLETLFSEDAAFRALTPSGMREGRGPLETVGWLRKWMGDATDFEVIESSVEPLVDRLRLGYRIKLQEEDGWHIVEQLTYCTLADDRISNMNLLCSGFRPIYGSS